MRPGYVDVHEDGGCRYRTVLLQCQKDPCNPNPQLEYWLRGTQWKKVSRSTKKLPRPRDVDVGTVGRACFPTKSKRNTKINLTYDVS